MKRYCLFLIFLLALTSCKNTKSEANASNEFADEQAGTETQVSNAFQEYFDKNADDPKSYESVETEVLDTLTLAKFAKEYSDRYITENLEDEIKLVERKKDIEESFEHYNPSAEHDIEYIVKFTDVRTNRINGMKKFLNNSEILCYMIKHKFRLKNQFGSLELDEKYFAVSSDLTKVYGMYPNDYEVKSKAIQFAISEYKFPPINEAY